MTMRVLFDTNVLLDVLGMRQPHYRDSIRAWNAAESGAIAGLVSADSFTTVFYVMRQASSAERAKQGLALKLETFEVVAIDESVIRDALASPFADFEDAAQYHAAVAAGADGIVTRDATGFRQADLPVLSPARLLEEIDD